MKYLLDTNTCIRYLNQRSLSIIDHFHKIPSQEIIICSVVRAELFYGAMKSQNPQRTLHNQQLFLDRFVTLPFDDKAALVYGEIRAELTKLGRPIGGNDFFIAAIALAEDLIVVTHNTEEFKRIPRLRLEDWEI